MCDTEGRDEVPACSPSLTPHKVGREKMALAGISRPELGRGYHRGLPAVLGGRVMYKSPAHLLQGLGVQKQIRAAESWVLL